MRMQLSRRGLNHALAAVGAVIATPQALAADTEPMPLREQIARAVPKLYGYDPDTLLPAYHGKTYDSRFSNLPAQRMWERRLFFADNAIVWGSGEPGWWGIGAPGAPMIIGWYEGDITRSGFPADADFKAIIGTRMRVMVDGERFELELLRPGANGMWQI